MPRPLRKLPRPEPQPVVLRHMGEDRPSEVVAPDELVRRKEEADWQRYRRSHGLDVQDEHARLGLDLGDPITVPIYTGDVWWLVRDVNGIDRTITAGTILFDQARERTFPFDLVQIVRLWHMDERLEAARGFREVQRRLGKARVQKRRAA